MSRAGRAPFARWAAWLTFLAVGCGGGGAQTEGPPLGPEPELEEAGMEAPDTVSEIVVIPKAEEAPAPEDTTLPEFPEALPPEPAMVDTGPAEVFAPWQPAPAPSETAMAAPPAGPPTPELLPPLEMPPPAPIVVEPNTVSPGMTEDQVRGALGAPIYVRAYGDHTYYFYDNSREKQAGFLDFVTFRAGQVVDAVFRHPDRRYTGNSSSPPGVTPRPNPGGAMGPSPDDRLPPPQ